MLPYRATVEVSKSTARAISGCLHAHREPVNARLWQRPPRAEPKLFWSCAGWFVQGANLRDLVTAYRRLHEAINVIANHCPDLIETLQRLQEAGELFVCLDGTPVPTSARTPKR